MSQPEIFRRCSACGASCRTGELFCAQCGNSLAQSAIPAEQNLDEAENDLTAETNTGQGISGADETQPLPSTPLQTSQPVLKPDDSRPGTVTATNDATASAVIGRSSHGPRTTRQKPRFAARAAMEERMKPGVDKLRRVSGVVLDEAAYDPSVRFILVVGVLFVFFLVLLLLSKWIG